MWNAAVSLVAPAVSHESIICGPLTLYAYTRLHVLEVAVIDYLNA